METIQEKTILESIIELLCSLDFTNVELAKQIAQGQDIPEDDLKCINICHKIIEELQEPNLGKRIKIANNYKNTVAKKYWCVIAAHLYKLAELPRNIVSGKIYQGENLWDLVIEKQKKRYASSEWGTYEQFQKVGRAIIRGQKAIKLKFFKEDDETQKIVCKPFFVFSWDQTCVNQFTPAQKIITQDADVKLYSDFFDKEESSVLFRALNETIEFKQYLTAFGSKTPRLEALYGEAGKVYEYGGKKKKKFVALEWTPELLLIKKKVEKVAKVSFNVVFINYYQDGNDSCSEHTDKDEYLKEDVIASVNFGASRKFTLKSNENKVAITIILDDGSMLLMGEGTQENYTHSVPKQKEVKEPRINLTFRVIH